jgi:hypothetical protein
MRLSEITTTAEKQRLFQMRKAAAEAKHKAAMERYRQQVRAYDEKARTPRKPGQKVPVRPQQPKPLTLPKPAQA